MADRLAVLLQRFPIAAEVFNAGTLCGLHALHGDDDDQGQVHLIRRGPLEVLHGNRSLRIEQPSLLLYPRPMPHRFRSDDEVGADLVCANLRFDGGSRNPIRSALPAFVCLPLHSLDGAAPVLELLFDEALTQRCGRVAVVNRLFEVVLIQVLRAQMEAGEIEVGLLAGLGHPRLRHALIAVHEAPAQPWTLDSMAETAGMSRSVFAQQFRDALGVTPGTYLQDWRVRLAQQALRRGRPLKAIATEVGYGSEAALSRAFKAQSGLSPRQWRNQTVAG